MREARRLIALYAPHADLPNGLCIGSRGKGREGKAQRNGGPHSPNAIPRLNGLGPAEAGGGKGGR